MPRGIPRSPRKTAVEKPEQAPVSQRATELRRERRRREPGDIDVMARMKLAIPTDVQEKLKREGMTARWALDKGGRVQQLQAEEWDIVPGVPSVAASRSEEGQHVLMAKREDWYREDRAPMNELNKSREAAALKGDIGSEASEAGASAVSTSGFYTPEGRRNRISRGA